MVKLLGIEDDICLVIIAESQHLDQTFVVDFNFLSSDWLIGEIPRSDWLMFNTSGMGQLWVCQLPP